MAGLEETIWSEGDEARRVAFGLLVDQGESVPLVRLAIQVAIAEYPELVPHELMDRFRQIAADVESILPENPTDGDKITALNKHLFQILKFRGDEDEYYDPRNSYINDVLRRRVGMPISLCILYLDIAGRLDLSMVGVGLPGHFIVRYVGGGAVGEIYVDPYHAGKVLTRRECVDLVNRLTGGRLPWHDDYLQSVDNRHIITRLLNNLRGAYARLADPARALRVQNYLITLHPDLAHALRDRGLILVRLQSYRGALEDLKRYLRMAPNAPDVDQIREQIVELERRVQELC